MNLITGQSRFSHHHHYHHHCILCTAHYSEKVQGESSGTGEVMTLSFITIVEVDAMLMYAAQHQVLCQVNALATPWQRSRVGRGKAFWRRCLELHRHCYVFSCVWVPYACAYHSSKVGIRLGAYAKHVEISKCWRCVLCFATIMKQQQKTNSTEKWRKSKHTKHRTAYSAQHGAKKIIRNVRSRGDYLLFSVCHAIIAELRALFPFDSKRWKIKQK